MKLSIGNFTDLFLLEPVADITEGDNYLVCKCKTNPTYYYGNFILKMTTSPISKNEFEALFDKEFKNLPEVKHKTLIFNETKGLNQNSFQDFLKAGYKFELNKVLKLEPKEEVKLSRNSKVLDLDDIQTFNSIVQMHIDTRSFEFDEKTYQSFCENRLKNYKKLINLGMGQWFGTYQGKKLVSSLGLFYKKDIARFQVVATDPSEQNKGFAKELLQFAMNYATESWNSKQLIIIADPTYHAIKLYKKLGFSEIEEVYSLCLYPSKQKS